MYLNHYGLRKKPFRLVHDPAFYYAAPHQIPLNELSYSIEERQGLATLVGEPGTGKTTLLRRLLQSFGPDLRGVFLPNSSLGKRSLLRQFATALGIPARAAVGLAQAVSNSLHREAAAERTAVLLIDEAQGLTTDQLEQMRYLTNLEMSGRKLVEIIMAGQPSLEKRLAVPELASLRQRVFVRATLEGLSVEHTGAYIEHRLRVGGAPDPRMFTLDAVQAIHEGSGGIPRLINIICDRALVVGYVDQVHVIDRAKVVLALAELRIEKEQESASSSTAARTSKNDLLMRVGFRLDSVEEKLEGLMHALVRGGYIRPEFADSPAVIRWLKSLKQCEQKATKETSEDV